MTQSTTVLKKRPKRRRLARRSVYYCRVTFEMYTPPNSFSERLRIVEEPINDAHLKEDMDKTFDLWLKGNVDPVMVRGHKFSAAVAKMAKETTSYKEGKTVKYRAKEAKLTKAYVASMKYYETDGDGYEEEEDGSPVKPWIHVVFNDGSQIDLDVKRKRRK